LIKFDQKVIKTNVKLIQVTIGYVKA